MKEKQHYTKKLLSNTLIFAIGNFSSRILVFFLIPLYARTLSTIEYGMVDLISTTINLIIPMFGLNIHEAILRFTLDKASNNRDVISVGIKTAILGFIPVLVLAPMIMMIVGTTEYTIYFLVVYLITAFKNIFSYYARGVEKVKLVVGLGVVDTLLLLVLNYTFLVVLKQGIDGYYYSLIISGLVVLFFYIVNLNIKLSDIFHKNNMNIKKEMFKYAIPMIPNSLSWWVSNTSDKYILTYFWGVGITGVYAIAYKIPSLLNTVTSIFMQAWKISAVEEYEDKNDQNFSQVYRGVFAINMIVCGILIVCAELIGKIMFSQEFYEAVKFVPILLTAYFFNGLASYLGSIYTASKKTNMLFISTSIGAIVNIILNIILIPKYGAYGAAIATLISYFIIWIIRLINTKSIVVLEYNNKNNIYQVVLLLGITICMSVQKNFFSEMLTIIFLILIVCTNIDIIKMMANFMIKKLNNKKIRRGTKKL